MEALDIKIDPGFPEIKIVPDVQGTLKQFQFDEEDKALFREGVVLAGSRPEVVDSLTISFNFLGRGGYRSVSRYDTSRHRIHFHLFAGDSHVVRLDGGNVTPWPEEPDTRTTAVNFSLAYHAGRIAQISRRDPETLVDARSVWIKSFLGRKGASNEINTARINMRNNALEFAITPEARELFSQVAQVQYL